MVAVTADRNFCTRCLTAAVTIVATSLLLPVPVSGTDDAVVAAPTRLAVVDDSTDVTSLLPLSMRSRADISVVVLAAMLDI